MISFILRSYKYGIAYYSTIFQYLIFHCYYWSFMSTSLAKPSFELSLTNFLLIELLKEFKGELVQPQISSK